MKLEFFNTDLIRIEIFLVNQILTNLLLNVFKGNLLWIRE